MDEHDETDQNTASCLHWNEQNMSKDDLVASLYKPDEDAPSTVVPQTTLNRSDRSQPGAFRVLTARQAQSAAAEAARNQDTASESSLPSDGATPVLDATVVATAVDTPEDERGGVTEVFKAVPLETAAKQTWPRSVVYVVVVALVMSAASLWLAFGMRAKSASMGYAERQVGVPSRPFELFEPYDKITAHMAFIAAEIPKSCKLEDEPISIHISCGDSDVDSILQVFVDISQNIERCDYSDDHRTATCAIGNNRRDFSFVAYSCGFRMVDDASSTVSIEETTATCTQSGSHDFDILNTQETILTALALGGLCWNEFGEVEYKSIETQCRDKDYLLLDQRGSTDTCFDIRMDYECTGNNDGCVLGSYGIKDSGDDEYVCQSYSWDSSVFGPEKIQLSVEYLDLIALANRGFAKLFDEEVGG